MKTRPITLCSIEWRERETHGLLAAQIGTIELFVGTVGRGWPHTLGRRAQSAGAEQFAGDEARRSRLLLSFERGQRDRRGRGGNQNILPRSGRQERQARDGRYQ